MAAIEERDGGALLRRQDVAAEPDPARAHARLRRRVPRAAVTGRRTSCSSRSAARRGCGRRTRSWPASLRRAGATVVDGARRAAARVAHVRADRARLGALGARAATARRSTSTARGRSLYSSTTAALLAPRAGGDPLRRPGRRQPPGPPRRSGSARSSGGGCATRRCSCRGARAGWPRRRSRAPDAVVVPVPVERRAARPARATSPRSRTARIRRRRASTACSPRGRRLGTTGKSSSSPASTRGLAAGEAWRPRSAAAARRRGPLRGDALARRVPRAAAARAGVRLRAAAGGLRHRAARGARRRLPARHHALARAVRGAAAGARSSTRGSSAGSPRGSGPRSTTRRPATPTRAAELLAPWRPEAVDRGGARAAAAAASLAAMTPISGQSVLITGAAHGIGAETARRLAARGARVSLVGLGDLEAVAADCPGSDHLRGRRHRPRRARRRRRRHGRGVRRHRHRCSPAPGSARRGFVRTHGPGDVRARHRGQPDRRVAHDPRLPAARDRAPRLHPAGRVDGRDRSRRSGSAPTARRSRASRTSRHALRVETQATASTSASPTSRGSTPRWSAAPTAPSSARACARCSPVRSPSTYPVSAAAEAVVRGIERRQRIVAVPRWLIAPDVAQADPPAADRARAAQGHRALRRAGRARGPRARERAGRRRRRGRAGRAPRA